MPMKTSPGCRHRSGGGGLVSPELDRAARLAVSQLAGHARARAAGAYLGQSVLMRSKAGKSGDLNTPDATAVTHPAENPLPAND